MTVSLGIVETVTDQKTLLDDAADIIDSNVFLTSFAFVNQGAKPHTFGIKRFQMADQEFERKSGIDNILNDEYIFAADIDFDFLGQRDGTAGTGVASVTGEPNKIDFNRNCQMSDKIGQKNEGPFQNTNQNDFTVFVIM